MEGAVPPIDASSLTNTSVLYTSSREARPSSRRRRMSFVGALPKKRPQRAHAGDGPRRTARRSRRSLRKIRSSSVVSRSFTSSNFARATARRACLSSSSSAPHDQNGDRAEAGAGHVGDEIAHPAVMDPRRALGDLDEESQREAREERPRDSMPGVRKLRDGEHEEDREPHQVLDIEQRGDRNSGAERPFALHRPHSARLEWKVEQRQRKHDRVGPAARAKCRLRPARAAQSKRDARDHYDQWQWDQWQYPHAESVDELRARSTLRADQTQRRCWEAVRQGAIRGSSVTVCPGACLTR